MEDAAAVTRRMTIALLVVLGAGAILVGALVEGSYAQGLLLNLGTGVLLFAVLYLVQLRILDRVVEAETQHQDSVRELTREVDEVREAVRSTEARLGELGDQTRSILDERLKATADAFEAFRANVTCETTLVILQEAVRVGGISRNGVRVAIPDARCWLRFSGLAGTAEPATGGPSKQIQAVWLEIEEMDGSRLGDIYWEAPTTAAEVMAQLAQRLQQLGRFPGTSHFSPDDIFLALQEVLDIAVSVRTRTRGIPGDLGPLIEVPNDQWAITEDGLECLERPYVITKDRLDANWSKQMSSKPWVDMDQFDWAFAVAQSLLQPASGPGPRPVRAVRAARPEP